MAYAEVNAPNLDLGVRAFKFKMSTCLDSKPAELFPPHVFFLSPQIGSSFLPKLDPKQPEPEALSLDHKLVGSHEPKP